MKGFTSPITVELELDRQSLGFGREEVDGNIWRNQAEYEMG